MINKWLIILFLLLASVSSAEAQPVLSPKSDAPSCFVNMDFNRAYDTKQDLEAVEALYNEINYYRYRNSISTCTVSERLVTYSGNWGAYMVSKHNGPNDNFYQHSKLGPLEYHIPANNTSEILHLLYFDHRPSSIEIVNGLMYGIARTSGNVIGWTKSTGHLSCITQDIVKYFGASIYVFKMDQWYCVYGTVNFSTIE